MFEELLLNSMSITELDHYCRMYDKSIKWSSRHNIITGKVGGYAVK